MKDYSFYFFFPSFATKYLIEFRLYIYIYKCTVLKIVNLLLLLHLRYRLMLISLNHQELLCQSQIHY